MPLQITIETTKNLKPKPDQKNLGFGKYFTDHMFTMDYSENNGWYNPRIIPYQPLSLDPATSALHYGQEIFEGMKAYPANGGKILLFRPRKNMERINHSNDRLCIPPIDVDFGVHAIKTLIKLDHDWIPTAEGTALYIRPFIIATDPFLGVRASNTYKFIIILSPVGAYYPQGITPVNIYVEPEYVRAVRGGTGFAKAAGNYAGSMKAQAIAAKKGYVQVLWLDGIEKKYIEEVGAMNVFFKIKGEVVTPALDGSILPGITRESVLFLLKHWNLSVNERMISIQELYNAYLHGEVEEAFGTGTAAVISPIGELNWNNNQMIINNKQIGRVAQKLYDTITGIQFGRISDEFGWTEEIQ
jgi:branched-chain amino acid aminotransferase